MLCEKNRKRDSDTERRIYCTDDTLPAFLTTGIDSSLSLRMTLCGKAALLLINGYRIKGNIPRIIQHSSIHHFKPNAKNLPLFTCGRFFLRLPLNFHTILFQLASIDRKKTEFAVILYRLRILQQLHIGIRNHKINIPICFHMLRDPPFSAAPPSPAASHNGCRAEES